MAEETRAAGRKVSFRCSSDEAEMLSVLANSPNSPKYDPTFETLSDSAVLRAALVDLAESGKNVTRKTVCDEPHITEATAHRLRIDLGRIGTNINMLSRTVNSGGKVVPSDLVEALKEYARVTAELQRELGASQA